MPDMSTAITIYPESSPSPYQARQAHAPNITNDDFFSGFQDLVDVFNPLQHIPIISVIYRGLTGDTISPGARIAGDTLFGGGLGFLSSLVNSVVEQETGKDIGANLFAAVSSSYEKTKTLVS